MNHIYLGAGAWGVAAAARRYFQKDLDQLTLAECALIAGLAKAPTAYSPIRSAKLATERRNVVLDKIAAYHLEPPMVIEAAKLEPIKLNLYRDVFPDRMPYYAEHVRRYIGERYGADALASRGLRIETAAEPSWEAGAYDNANFGARHQDKREGWRGPEWRVDASIVASAERARERRREMNVGPRATSDAEAPFCSGQSCESVRCSALAVRCARSVSIAYLDNHSVSAALRCLSRGSWRRTARGTRSAYPRSIPPGTRSPP